jgi:hypothetical protein
MFFDTKHYKTIMDSLWNGYKDYRFLFINMPDMSKKRSYLLFPYISNMIAFRKMVKELNAKGCNVSLKKTI